MTEQDNVFRIYDTAVVAHIAGELCRQGMADGFCITTEVIKEAVRTARAIVAEVQRTEPEKETT